MVATFWLVLAAIVAIGVAVLVIAAHERRAHAHMRPLRYHDDHAWRAFDAAMAKHTRDDKS